jgi:hypothetical protein
MTCSIDTRQHEVALALLQSSRTGELLTLHVYDCKLHCKALESDAISVHRVLEYTTTLTANLHCQVLPLRRRRTLRGPS